MLTVGTDSASCRAALATAEDFPQVYAAVGRHPNSATGFDDADFAELEALAAHEKCVAIGETGLDYYRDSAAPTDQRRAFEAQIELARAVGKPLIIHTRAADDETLALLGERAADLQVILHCFSMAARIEECLAHENWWFSFAGNATYPSAADLRAAALRVPADRLLVETDAPYLSPQPVRGAPQPAGQRRRHRAGDRGGAAGLLRRARAVGRRQRRCAVSMVSDPFSAPAGARSELPDRSQHPRRHRPAGGRLGTGCRARGRRRPGDAVGVSGPAGLPPPRGRGRRAPPGAPHRRAGAV